MFDRPLLALGEIAAIEKAASFGAPALAHAALALDARWRHGLRDEECLVRLCGVLHAAATRPDWLGGAAGAAALPDAGHWLHELGGMPAITPESRFGIGYLTLRAPAVLTGDAAPSARALLDDAAAHASGTGLLLRHVRYFTGERGTHADEVTRVRAALRNEIHARFAQRGLYGETLRRELQSALRTAGRQPRLR